MDGLDKLFNAIENLEKKFDQKAADDNIRFEAGQTHFRKIDDRLDEYGSRIAKLEHRDVELAENITRVSSAAAHAAEIGMKAQRRAADAIDEATKLVQSAMSIHSTSVAEAVKVAVRPLSDKVDGYDAQIKVSVEAAMKAEKEGLAKAVGESVAAALAEHAKHQKAAVAKEVNETVERAMKPVNDKVDTMVTTVDTFVSAATKTIKSRPLRIALLVAAIAGTGIGGAAFGWRSADELAKAKTGAAPSATTSSTPPATAPFVASEPPSDAGPAPTDASSDR